MKNTLFFQWQESNSWIADAEIEAIIVLNTISQARNARIWGHTKEV